MIVGFARSGLAAAFALKRSMPEARILACDIGRPAEAVALKSRLEQAGVEVHLQTDGLDLLEGEGSPRTLVKSPGVPREVSVVTAAKEAGLTIIGELELAWRMLENKFCAVTGTNGKTTTAEMIGSLFTEAGEPVEVVGNVGVAASSLVGRVDPDATVVCEASSFQLEDTVEFAPDTAVFLNFSEDHMDRHGSSDDYLEAKLRIFANQDGRDVAVLNAGEPVLRPEALPGSARSVWFGLEEPCLEHGGCSAYVKEGALWWEDERLLAVDEMRIRGVHNLENALASVGAGVSMGLDTGAVGEALKSFGGVRHRLEEVATVGGVLYVNDSKATNVASALMALKAFDAGVHLILGGSLKGGGFKLLREPVSERCSACYLIGEAAEALKRDLDGCGVPLEISGDLGKAVGRASEAAKPGEVVLLAPACASFDQFESFEGRGDRFHEIVSSLKGDR